MSGISFKISAPGRPSSGNAPSRSNNSRQHSHQRGGGRGDTYAEEGDSEDEDPDAFRRASGRESKRRRVDDEEEVVEFGRNGATSKHAKPEPAAPLVIPALPNKDWRKAAEELRAGRNPGKKRELYLPERGGGMRMREGESSNGAAAPITEAEVNAINTEEVVGGLEKREKKIKMEVDEDAADSKPKIESPPPPIPVQATKIEETEEQRAMRELLGEAGGATKKEEAELEAIYSAEDARNGPIEEADAFKRDVDSRPDEASLEDYARVPVGAFGLAMLRGMGWKPGQAASRSGRGAIEAHVPSSRPSLLGIGAKPLTEAMGGDGGKKGSTSKNGSSSGPGGKSRREEMKFMPLIKQAREGSSSGRSTPLPIEDKPSTSSRRQSRSPPPSSSSRHRDRSPRRERDDRRSSRRDEDDDKRRSSRYDDDRKSSRYDDDRKRSRYDDDRRSGSSRRDDRDSRRDSDRDRSHRDDRSRDRR